MQNVNVFLGEYSKKETTGEAVRDSLSRIYTRHAPTVFRVCYMFMKNKHDAEDMTQSVFVKLMNCNPQKSFDSHEHEKAWLIRTATNLCKDFFKSSWTKRVEIPEDLAYHDNRESENSDILEKVLALPDRFKIPIYLFYYEGYSTAEIAETMGKHESTVRGYLHRGRKILKIEIEKGEIHD